MTEKGKEMERRDFLKKGLMGLTGVGAASLLGGSGRNTGRPLPAENDGIIRRRLGKTGVSLPVVSMGVMNADNDSLVRAALDGGIVLLDTAHFYQRGRNEEMIGRVIKDRPRDSYFIATKVPWISRENGTERYLPETGGEKFEDLVDLSLKRLGLDHVDGLYCHDVDSEAGALFEPLLETLSKMKASGKTRFIGISTHSREPEVIRGAVKAKIYDVILTAYNFRRKDLDAINRAIAAAAGAGIGVIAMKTQAGRYWDKLKKDPINMRAALKWALNNPNVTTAIPGFTTFEQLETDLPVMRDLTLTAREKSDLRLGETQTGGFYCQQCGACLARCPKKLLVPDLMRSHMYAHAYQNYGQAHDLLSSLALPDNPCRECESCPVACASGFDIKDRIAEVAPLRDVPRDFFV